MSLATAADFPLPPVVVQPITRAGHYDFDPVGMFARANGKGLARLPVSGWWGPPRLGKEYVGDGPVRAHELAYRFTRMEEWCVDEPALAGWRNKHEERYQFTSWPEEYVCDTAETEFYQFLQIDCHHKFSFCWVEVRTFREGLKKGWAR